MAKIQKVKGVTLIELMIAVAVMGILAAVAYPSYTQYIQRSNRSEAMRELMRIANLQEQYFMDTRTYTADLTDLGFATSTFNTESGNYSIASALTGGGSGFTLTATAQGSQSTGDTRCTTFTVNNLGVKGAENAECWED